HHARRRKRDHPAHARGAQRQQEDHRRGARDLAALAVQQARRVRARRQIAGQGPTMTVKELQHLAAAMAHEVRNPLNSMAIHVELLEGRMRKEGAGAEILKSLTVLAAEIDRVDKILEQYLGYAGP